MAPLGPEVEASAVDGTSLLEALPLGPGRHVIGICFRAEAPDIVCDLQALGVPLQSLF